MADARIYKIKAALKSQVLKLLDDIAITCPEEADVLLVRVYFDTCITDTDLMDGFIKWVYPWRDKIAKHDETYFHENDHMFGPLPPEKVAHFKELYENGTFTPKDKIIIWKYFDIFIALIDQIQKIK